MIKEFWQERREDKKKQKQLKKENKKHNQTKEQIAYKIFGILFGIFIVIGSIGYACSSTGDLGEIQWGNLMGITDEMLDAINEPVDSNLLLTENVLASSDWEDAQAELLLHNIDIVNDGKLAEDLLIREDIFLEHDLTLSMMSLGALIYQFNNELGNAELLSFKLFKDGSNTMLTTVCSLDLGVVVSGVDLPMAYVTTTSRLTLLDEEVNSMNSQVYINQIDEEMNNLIVETLNSNSYRDIAFFTNTQMVGHINTIAKLFNANIEINGANIIFVPKD